MKKVLSIILVFILFLVTNAPSVFALGFNIKPNVNNVIIKEGEEIVVNVAVENLNNNGIPMYALTFDLSYDINFFETITENSITVMNNWELRSFNNNSNTLLFRNLIGVTEDGVVCSIVLKAKTSLELDNTEISIINAKTSDGEKDIIGTGVSTNLYVKKLDVRNYILDDETKVISNILPQIREVGGTNLETLKNNIIVGSSITIDVYNGEEKVNEGLIGTGMIMNLLPIDEEYWLAVKGDVTGNGIIDGADLVTLAKFLNGMQDTVLTGAYYVAADVTKNGTVDGTDLVNMAKVNAGMTNIQDI